MPMTKIDGRDVLVQSPVHCWFGLTYAAYFVVPRLALESMPLDWQRRFVALMEEGEGAGLMTPEYTVLRRGERGKYMHDPWADYRRGSVEAARAADILVADT